MISTNEFKNGKVIKVEGELCLILQFQHIKPGKGGAFVRTRLKNIRLDTVIDKTFRSGEKFEEAFIDQKRFQYLYKGGDVYHFMDLDTYESIELDKRALENCVYYLKENDEVAAYLYNGKIIDIEPPLFAELEVAATEPGIKGDTAKGGTKPAKLSTGLTIQVPLFINSGDIIRVDTRTGKYAGRA